MTQHRQFQFELWQECNNLCKFCFLGLENRKTLDEIKLKNLQRLKSLILDDDFISNYDNISLIGGEFFQGQLSNPEVKKAFFDVVDIIFDKMDKNEIKSSWIAATLTIGDQKDLYELLEKYSKTKSYQKYSPFTDNDGLWICTSYDTVGRFHTKEAEENWKYHMKKISDLYPNVKKNTCTIMTNDLMKKYINDEIAFEAFCVEYKTAIFFKPPDYGLLKSKTLMEERVPGFFPEKRVAQKFFTKILLKERDMASKIMNNTLRSDVLVKNYNDGVSKECKRAKNTKDEYGSRGDDLLPCGHNKFYQAYIDSDDCIKCDLEELEDLL